MPDPETGQPTELDKFATILGQVALKWNDIQFFVFVMFVMLDKSPSAEVVFLRFEQTELSET